jgi:MSHA pilin protein MshA
MRTKSKKKKRGWKKNEEGFTLVEIIAVLIILGVLAAVAIPKFMDLTSEAQQKAIDGAVSAGLSAVSLAYGQKALELGREPVAAEVVALLNSGGTVNHPSSGEYSYTFGNTGDDQVDISVQNSDGTVTQTATWTRP